MAPRHKIFVSRKRGVALCAIASAVALGVAAPAVAADSPTEAGARETLSDLATRAAADDHAVVQEGKRETPVTPGTRGVRGVTAGGTFYDAAGDNEGGLAPDLQRMVAATSDDGRYTVGIALNTNALIPGDLVATFVNTDGNPYTGSPTFGGADLAVSIVGQYGTDAVAASRWNGSTFQTVYSPSLASFPSGATDEVWSMSAAEMGVVPGARTTLVFGAMYSDVYDYFDFAPEPGLPPFSFTAGSLAPPPVAPAPAAASSPVAPDSEAGGDSATSPLALRSFTLSPRGGGVRIHLGWARGSGGVRWKVRLSGRANGNAVSKTVRGVGAAGTRTVTRTVALPSSWSASRVSAQLAVSNAGRTIHRSRTVLLPR